MKSLGLPNAALALGDLRKSSSDKLALFELSCDNTTWALSSFPNVWHLRGSSELHYFIFILEDVAGGNRRNAKVESYVSPSFLCLLYFSGSEMTTGSACNEASVLRNFCFLFFKQTNVCEMGGKAVSCEPDIPHLQMQKPQ